MPSNRSTFCKKIGSNYRDGTLEIPYGGLSTITIARNLIRFIFVVSVDGQSINDK